MTFSQLGPLPTAQPSPGYGQNTQQELVLATEVTLELPAGSEELSLYIFFIWCFYVEKKSPSKMNTCEAERRNAVRRCESMFTALMLLSRASCERFGSVITWETSSVHKGNRESENQRISSVFPYHHRLHSSLEDAASTSHTPLPPLSECLGLHCPRYTGHMPDMQRHKLFGPAKVPNVVEIFCFSCW